VAAAAGVGGDEDLGFHRLGIKLYTVQREDCGFIRVNIKGLFAKMCRTNLQQLRAASDRVRAP
jgi:hypothetical protein